MHLARKLGVKFILDPSKGNVVSIIDPGSASTGGKPIVKTADGREELVDLVVVAGEYLPPDD